MQGNLHDFGPGGPDPLADLDRGDQIRGDTGMDTKKQNVVCTKYLSCYQTTLSFIVNNSRLYPFNV